MSSKGENEMVNGKCCHLEPTMDTDGGSESSNKGSPVTSETELLRDSAGSHCITHPGVLEGNQSNEENIKGLNKVYEISGENPCHGASHIGHPDNVVHRTAVTRSSENKDVTRGSDTEILQLCQGGHQMSVSGEAEVVIVDVVSQRQSSDGDGHSERVTMVTQDIDNALNDRHDANFQDSHSEDTDDKEKFLTNNILQNYSHQMLKDIDCDMSVQDMAGKPSVPIEPDPCPTEKLTHQTVESQEQMGLIMHDVINDTSSMQQPYPCQSSTGDNAVKGNACEAGTGETDNGAGYVHIPDDTFLGSPVSDAQVSPFNSEPDLSERETHNHTTVQCEVMVNVGTSQSSPIESYSECNHVLFELGSAPSDGAITQISATNHSVSVTSPVDKCIQSDKSGQTPAQCESVSGINGGEAVTVDDFCDSVAHQACVSQEPADNEEEVINTGAISSHLDTSNIPEIRKLHDTGTSQIPLCTDELNHDNRQDSVDNEVEVSEVPSQSLINDRTSPSLTETGHAFGISTGESETTDVIQVVPGEGDLLPGTPDSLIGAMSEVNQTNRACEIKDKANALKPEGSQRTRDEGGSTDMGNRKRRKGRAKYKRRLAKAEETYKCKKQQHHVSVQPEPGYSEKPWTEAHDSLTCPICLDLYFRPHLCRPCGHIFCESCLRRLAKYDSVRERPTVCPICRIIIKDCIPDQDMVTQIMCFLPDEYSEREHTERNSRFMAHPLPSHREAPVIDLRRLALAVQQRRQQSRARVGREPIPISFWKFLLLVVCFLFLKGTLAVLVFLVCSLFYSTGPLDLAWGTFSKYVMNYKSLSEGEQINLANASVIVILLLGVLFWCIQKLERGYRIQA